MAALGRLVPTKNLKTTFWSQHSIQRTDPEDLYYNKDLDALSLRIVSRKVETVVHYIDEHVALLYRPSDLEIVGIRIEDFENGFLPKYAELQKIWRLSDNCKDIEDFGDLLITTQKKESQISGPLTDVTSLLAKKQGLELTPMPV